MNGSRLHLNTLFLCVIGYVKGSTTMKKLLIDGDIILYRATSAAEQEFNFGGDHWMLYSDFNHIRPAVEDYVHTLVKNSQIDEVEFAFSDMKNFRKDINPEYKANRIGTRKPMAYPAAKEWVQENYKTHIWENLEADDVLGILGSQSDEYVLVSADKDLQTIPTTLYDYESKEYISIDKRTANLNWLTQTLTGDPTDNYKGCPKVGKVSAAKLLSGINCDKDFTKAWGVVVGAFEKAGLTTSDALLNARMARILRDGDYNLKTGEVKLWQMQ